MSTSCETTSAYDVLIRSGRSLGSVKVPFIHVARFWACCASAAFAWGSWDQTQKPSVSLAGFMKWKAFLIHSAPGGQINVEAEALADEKADMPR